MRFCASASASTRPSPIRHAREFARPLVSPRAAVAAFAYICVMAASVTDAAMTQLVVPAVRKREMVEMKRLSEECRMRRA